jgi:serine protease DegS/serine protease DegQ
MQTRALYNLAAFVVRCVVIGLAAAFVLSVFAPRVVERLRGTPGAERSIAASSRGPQSYASAVARASPAVVNIYANRITASNFRQRLAIFDPLSQRLLGYVPGPVIPRRDQSLGSGVIFGADGYVLTNNHVVTGADDIQVVLDDGQPRRAQVVGTDVETDLAVLHIDAKNLPTIDVRDGSAVEVGDVVLAIGNPAGVGKTVTMGIVSATGRQLKMSAFEDFIQTDAAINAGNSGGALVDSEGELVGINTAVYATPIASETSRAPQMPEGIGFAIPVATAKAVLDQIIQHGHVIRGWIGADYSDVPPQNSGEPHQPGVMLVRIVPDGPAAKAGLQAGDILTQLDGNDIADQMDLLNREAAITPGAKAHLEGLRNNQPFGIDIVMAQRPTPSTGT